MAASAFKTLILPALISLAIFLTLTFAIIPFWRRYRNRYSQYLPIDAISDQTASLRHRVVNRIVSMILPASWNHDRQVASAAAEDEELEEGEELSAVDAATLQALERRLGESRLPESTRRLSRDLEEGFIDDSDDEGDSRIRQ